MSMITGDWQEALSDEFRKDYYKKLYTFVKNEYNSCVPQQMIYSMHFILHHLKV